MNLQTNPLLIDIVMEKVFRLLSEKDLKTCRLVCIKWYQLATKCLKRTSSPICFGYLNNMELLQQFPDLVTIKKFISTMKNCNNLPYLSFDLRSSTFTPENLPLLQDFFDNFGPKIASLAISLSVKSAEHFLPNCFPNLDLRGLKSLYFSNTIQGERRPLMQTELFSTRYNLLRRVLNAATNLESLSFWSDSENIMWPGEAVEVLNAVELPKLSSLKVSFPITNALLVNLQKLTVRLTTLTFLIREPIFDSKGFCQILHSQRWTLRNLKVIDLQCNQTKELELPIEGMGVLEVLEIEGTFFGDCKLSMDNFSLEYVPRIKSIILRNCHSLNFDLESLFPTHTVCKTLNELHITLSEDFVNDLWIEKFSKMFPNLKNLQVIFCSGAKFLLTSIFKFLTGLDKLTINVVKCGENLDAVLTGVLNVFGSDFKPISRHFQDNFDADDFRRRKDSLVNLLNLRTLEFKGERKSYKNGTSVFTDISAYLAFLSMPKLRNLVIWQSNSGYYSLSEKCVEDLTQRLNLVRMTDK